MAKPSVHESNAPLHLVGLGEELLRVHHLCVGGGQLLPKLANLCLGRDAISFLRLKVGVKLPRLLREKLDVVVMGTGCHGETQLLDLGCQRLDVMR